MLSHAVLFDAIDRHLQALRDGGDEGRVMGLLVLRVQRLRELNIRLGYDSVRELLEVARSRIVATLRPQDEVGEFAPGEFVVVLPTVMSANHALLGAHRLAQAFQQPLRANGHEVVVNVVIGVSAANGGEATSEQLLRQADTAYGHALKEPDRVALHEHDDGQVVPPYEFLRDAIASNRLAMHLQPIYDLRDGRLVGAEALARWPDSPLGPVPPDVFIPLAEERGIIGPLSQLVLRKATETARHWPDELFLSFNLSPSQLVDQNTAQHILAILQRTGFDPRRLEIEITETGLMTDAASAEKIVDDLRAYGIRISLDDFGTGQSSLGRLREFNFDKLKIDRAFVSSILDDKPSEHIIRAILAMCEGLGMEVVAEGIEEEAQASRLVQFGCGGGQGYLFGKPRDADATMGYLRDAYLTGIARRIA